jgi:hypothetical protein
MAAVVVLVLVVVVLVVVVLAAVVVMMMMCRLLGGLQSGASGPRRPLPLLLPPSISSRVRLM